LPKLPKNVGDLGNVGNDHASPALAKTFLERACFSVVGVAFDELPRMLARRRELAGIAFESRERKEDVSIAWMPCQRRNEHANRRRRLAGLVQRQGISVAER